MHLEEPGVDERILKLICKIYKQGMWRRQFDSGLTEDRNENFCEHSNIWVRYKVEKFLLTRATLNYIQWNSGQPNVEKPTPH